MVSFNKKKKNYDLKAPFSGDIYLLSFWWENGFFETKMTEKQAILTLFHYKNHKIGSIEVPSNAINPMV